MGSVCGMCVCVCILFESWWWISLESKVLNEPSKPGCFITLMEPSTQPVGTSQFITVSSSHRVKFPLSSAVRVYYSYNKPQNEPDMAKQKGEDRLFGDTSYLSEKSHKQTHPLTYPSDPLHPEKMALPPSPAGAREELVWELDPWILPFPVHRTKPQLFSFSDLSCSWLLSGELKN